MRLVTTVIPVNQLSVAELCLLCSVSCSTDGPDPVFPPLDVFSGHASLATTA